MTLENQVVSLELAKRLKELGVKQESYFSWLYADVRSGDVWYVDLTDKEHMIETPDCSAFTVAELGDIFPANVQLPFKRSGYDCWFWSSFAGRETTDTEANARAKMLVYLIENNLITL